MRLYLAICALWSAFAITLSHAQVAAVSGMTADSHCGNAGYCFTALYNPSIQMINYTLIIPQGGQTGWWGVAQGRGMAGANMAINWINADGSTTTSHRSAPGEVTPSEGQVRVPMFSINTEIVKSSSSQSVWSWNMPVPAGAAMNSVPHIFAHSRTNPSSSASSASIVKHNVDEDDITIDLTKAYTGEAPAGLVGAAGATTGSSSGSNTSGSGSSAYSGDGERSLQNPFNRIIIAHMVFMIAGWMLCFPAGILLARYGRTFFTWFPHHRLIQSVGFLFVFIGFFLAIGAVSVDGGDHISNTHEMLGLALFILLFVQVLLGVASHSLKRRKGSRVIGYLHIPFGLLLFALSVWNIHEGFNYWDWAPPAYASYIIYAWAGLMTLLYLIGFAFLPREIRQNREQGYVKN